MTCDVKHRIASLFSRVLLNADEWQTLAATAGGTVLNAVATREQRAAGVARAGETAFHARPASRQAWLLVQR